MGDAVRVSVVVNNYNYADFVGEAIASGLAQTYPFTEVVVVDDGSTDSSREVIARFADRVQVVLQANGGQAAALNAGMRASTGDVVLVLDADDRLAPDAAALCVDLLTARPDAALVQLRMRVCDASLRPSGTVVPPAHVRLPLGDVSAAVAAWELPSALGPGGAVALPRATVDAVFPMPVRGLRYGPDTYVVRAAALLGPVVSSDAVIGDYRSHGRNDSNRDQLDVGYLRDAIARQVEVGRLLGEFAAAHRLRVPIDPLLARDPILLSHRLASLRIDPAGHPVRGDTRWGLLRSGAAAALARRDLGLGARVVHASWFVVVAAVPSRRAATWLATLLLFPLSRQRLRSRVPRGRS